ncbi:uncharacterized protein [Nothobranchius furzeri]|uniref:uncharacterized protein isoform X2 n=1 Tax=Nothobranchius furzeri TaxID=105023 RepID=UPI003904AAFE
MEDHIYSSSKLEKRDSLSHPSKRKRILKSEQDRRHEKTRVNIGVAFPRWRDLMLQKGFSRHAELATFLLDRFKRKYNKNARRYSVYSLKSEKGYEYILVLQSKIINERLARGVGMPRTRSMRDDDPRRLGLVPPIAPPPISELVQIQVSRGLVSELNTATGLQ